MRTQRDRRRGVRRRGRVAHDRGHRGHRRARRSSTTARGSRGPARSIPTSSRRRCAKRATTPRSANPTSGTALASPADVNGVGAARRSTCGATSSSRCRPTRRSRIALELERATKAADARIRNVESAGYGDSLARGRRSPTRSASRPYTRRTTCSASSVALADDGSGTQTGYGFAAGRTLADLDLDVDPARRRRPRACRLLGAKPIAGPADPGRSSTRS